MNSKQNRTSNVCCKMHVLILMLVVAIACAKNTSAQLPMFDQDKINAIKLFLPADSLSKLYQLDKKYQRATMVYTNGVNADTVNDVAIRFRGNTSLISKKKSIKVSFNEYNDTLRYKGIRKLNLIGNHNDPTTCREKLFYVCSEKIGLPRRRVSFVNLYVNNVYFGICTNVEEIDKEWLKDVYKNNDGNLYKCSFGADLNYIDANTNTYKNLWSGSNLTYDLQTNEIANDFTDLVQLITAINNPNNSNYLSKLDSIFEYKEFLKSYALDIATGNWDNYAYNAANYELYHDSISKKFRFITIDTDNTFGVDWVGVDWTTRDAFNWQNSGSNIKRPLVTRLLAQASAKALLSKYLDSAFKYVVNADTLFPVLDTFAKKLLPHVAIDSFYTLDYGYDTTDFKNGFITTVDAHTPYGIKPFIDKRRKAFVALGVQEFATRRMATVYPNPCSSEINFGTAAASEWQVLNSNGQLMMKGAHRATINIAALQKGWYTLAWATGDEKYYAVFLKE